MSTKSSVAPNESQSQPEADVHHDELKLKKVVVAVHGIGKQSRFATIQSVVGRFGSYSKRRAAVPLGNFHSECKDGIAALRFPDPPYPEDFPNGLADTGFAEIFWADIPSEAVNSKDTLEETKAWAKTVIERLRLMDRQTHQHESVNYEKCIVVIEEMVDTIGVLENLLRILKKLGLGSFDLHQLLTDYVGDIQIVTEFANYRTRILNHFHKVLRELNQRHQPEEIHIIAHSEGTVVAFLGLLQALSRCDSDDYAWANKVVGFMTIGSPIDKHLVLWPKLWEGLQPPKTTTRTRPIDWRNYYDHGDPVGFELDTARQWLIDGKWMSEKPAGSDLFYFPKDKDHDCGFTRYPFPGKAHNDYWKDEELFRHFIGNVIDPPAQNGKAPRRPRDSQLFQVVSWIVPYIICFVLLLLGTYTLYKPASNFVNAEQAWSVMFFNVLAIGSVLAGMTVMARVPRMTKCIWKYSISVLVFVVSAFIYKWLIEPSANAVIGLFFAQHFGWQADTTILWVLGGIAVISGVISYSFPRSGLKCIVVLLGLLAFAVVWSVVTGPGELPNGADKPPIWPVVLGGAAFLYLWWLSALLFDLVFVWHRYIRYSRAVEFLRTCNTKSKKAAGDVYAPDVVGAGVVP